MITFYDFRWQHRPVPITYVADSNGREVDDCLLGFISRALGGKNGRPLVFGVDFEWRPDRRGSNNPIAVMQLASSEDVLVISLAPLKYKLTKGMKTLLKDGWSGLIHLVGYDLRQDSRKLAVWNSGNFTRSWSSNSPHVVDLAFCVEPRLPGAPAQPIGLNKLSEEVLGEPGKCDRRLATSEWARRLSPEQVRYAARDAWVARQIYTHSKVAWDRVE